MIERLYHVQYGDTTIEYTLAYASRKTLAISVAPDLSVRVTAPAETALDAIEAKVRQRAPWIVRQQRELEQYLPATPPRQYVNGETHRYLGRQYRLKVIQNQPDVVKLTRGWLYVYIADTHDTAHVKQLVDAWYHTQAERVFHERLAAMLPRFQHLDLCQPNLTIKPLQARWGSCTGSGTITLNVRLMQVPKQYIDYVIVHELCHLIEHNHSKRFYQLLDRMMPDWRESRQKLNEVDCSISLQAR
jgi:predicted metal-dependent hydrolase